MLLLGLGRERGEEQTRPARPAVPLVRGDDELGVDEHVEVRPDRVRVQPEGVGELLRPERRRGRAERVEQSATARLRESAMATGFTVHGQIFPTDGEGCVGGFPVCALQSIPRCPPLSFLTFYGI